jgi:hypothetical protein
MFLEGFPMCPAHAFWRLFTPALFLIVGLMLSLAWRPDPVLMSIAMCGAAAATAWFVLAILGTARSLFAEGSLKASQK